MASNKNKLQILVVEDTPADVFLIKFYLEEFNPGVYEFSEAPNLEAAYQMLQREQYDIVLLDLHLPDSDGLITLSRTIEKFPDEVFIVLTGLSDEKMGIEAVKIGAEDFLVKGRMDSKTLNNAIRFSYERSKLKRTLKLFGEGIKLFENYFKILTIFVDKRNDTVYHSVNFNHRFGNETKLDTIQDLYNLFGGKDLLEQKINELSENNCVHFESSIKGELFNVCIQHNSNYVNDLVISLTEPTTNN